MPAGLSSLLILIFLTGSIKRKTLCALCVFAVQINIDYIYLNDYNISVFDSRLRMSQSGCFSHHSITSYKGGETGSTGIEKLKLHIEGSACS
jgi:hypothetical protein